MHLLVLGGTQFVGRAVVDAAVAAGHEVTLFNRGRTNPGLYPQLETVFGDRTEDLSALHGRRFDVVVDVAGYHPDVVSRSAEAFAATAGRYVFVSTVDVYADQSVPPVEGAALRAPDERTDDPYGPHKVACEQIVEAAYGDRSFIVRPGSIVGPHDPTDRFTYWPQRVARGGRVLVPGGPDDPMQFVDARDLGAFIVAGAAGLSGAYNVVRPPQPMAEFLDVCREVAGSDASFLYVPGDRLLAAGVDPWEGIPMWIGEPGWQAANRVDAGKARAAGLVTRPVAETVADTPAWDAARGVPQIGLHPDDEARLLTLALAP
jgi:2'-hydroxyisoflavone reductase